MKGLALFLLLVNLGFLAWGMWIAPDPGMTAVVPSAPSGVPRLQLASELPPEPARAEENAPAVEPVAAGPVAPDVPGGAAGAITRAPHCISLGPFLDLAETAEAAARLREQGRTPIQRLSESPVWVGHWVYLAPSPSREAALALVEELRAQGITDLYIEPSGEQQNAVSLGLFSERERADSYAARVRRLGFDPQIGDRFRTASVYWVDLVLPPDVALAPGDYQARPGRIVRSEERACPPGTEMPAG